MIPLTAAYLLSWGWVLGYYLLGGRVDNTFYPLFSVTLMWIPGLTALYFGKKEHLSLPIRAKWNSYFLWSMLTPILIGLITVVLSAWHGEWKSFKQILQTFDPLILKLFPVAALIAAFMYTFAALGEELLWRGYLWEKWKHHGFWKASLLTGLAWYLWHWPIILMGHNYIGYPYLGHLMMLGFILAASPLTLYYRIKTNSILGAALFHGFLNIAGTFTTIVYINPNELTLDVEGIVGFITLTLFNLWIFFRYSATILLRK